MAKILFKKLDLQKLDEIPEKIEILFIEENKNGFAQEFVGTLQRAKDFRRYQLENDWTHYLILPKIIHKK